MTEEKRPDEVTAGDESIVKSITDEHPALGGLRAPEEYYDEVEVFGGMRAVEDPFDEKETDIALEMLVETEGGEVGFETAWESAKGMIRYHTDKYEHSVAAMQLLELERACYDEGLEIPKDFRYEFERAFSMMAADFIKDLAHGAYDNALEILRTLEEHGKDSKVIDREQWLYLSTTYNNEVAAYMRYLTVKDPEQHGETIEVKGPEILRDMMFEMGQGPIDSED